MHATVDTRAIDSAALTYYITRFK